jgi:hypothetical protein
MAADGTYPAWMNFVVCPYDDIPLKAVRGPAGPVRPLLMHCPVCGKQFKLDGGRAVEADQGESDPEA